MNSKQLLSILLLITIAQSQLLDYYIETRKVTETLQGEGPKFAEELTNQILDGEAFNGYCKQEQPRLPFNNAQHCDGKNKDIGWIFSFTFTDGTDGEIEYNDWEFKIDAFLDRGVVIYIDEEYQFSRNIVTTTCEQEINQNYVENLYDALLDEDAGTVTVMKPLVISTKLRSGTHTITIFGSESGGKGTFDVYFRKNGGLFQEFRYKNLKCALDLPNLVVTATSKTYYDLIDGLTPQDFAWNLLAATKKSTIPGGTCHVNNPEWPITYGDPCGRNADQTVWNYQIDFHLMYGTRLKFDIGAEFKDGFAVFINNELSEVQRGEYVYWYNSWSDDGVIQIRENFAAGIHKINIIGIEGCCDGATNGKSSIRFKVAGSQDWYMLNQPNWDEFIPKPLVKIVAESRFAGENAQQSDFGSPSNEDEYVANLVDSFFTAETQEVEGYCRKEDPQFPLNNRSMCGGNNKTNILWQFAFYFVEQEYFENEEDRPVYTFEFGTDFGWGGAVYVNGAYEQLYLLADNQDEWWNGNWDSNGVFSVSYRANAGQQLVEFYGAEGCCDGKLDVRFKRNDADFITLSEFQRQNSFEYCDFVTYIQKQEGYGSGNQYSQIIMSSIISILAGLLMLI